MKKVLFILAKEGFRDEEFFTPAEILKNAGNQFFVASDAPAGKIAIGANGGDIKIDFDYKNINPVDFDLIVFVGGPGALNTLTAMSTAFINCDCLPTRNRGTLHFLSVAYEVSCRVRA